MTRLPILTFHSVDSSGSPISMARQDLEGMLGALANDGWEGTTLSAALAGARAERASPRRLGLCFDDGYRSVLREALPVLRDLGFTATVFVIAGRCGADNRWPGQAAWVPTLPLLGWDELNELAAAGWEIGSHGIDHLPFTALTAAAVADQMQGARHLLARHVGQPTALLAYPYGEHDEAIENLAREHYDAAFGVRLALASAGDLDARFAIPRIDAHYLRHLPSRILREAWAGRSYLALRRWLRAIRGAHWSPGSSVEP